MKLTSQSELWLHLPVGLCETLRAVNHQLLGEEPRLRQVLNHSDTAIVLDPISPLEFYLKVANRAPGISLDNQARTPTSGESACWCENVCVALAVTRLCTLYDLFHSAGQLRRIQPIAQGGQPPSSSYRLDILPC